LLARLGRKGLAMWQLSAHCRGLMCGLLALFFLVPQAWGQFRPDDYITVRQGKLPILVTAPHGGQKFLPGVGIRRQGVAAKLLLTPDEHTDEIAEKIASDLQSRLGQTPYLILAHFHRRQVDANREEKDAFDQPPASEVLALYTAYHKAIAEACADIEKTWGRGVLVDVHGQSAEPEGIFRGTGNGQTVAQLLREHGAAAIVGPNGIPGALTSKGYRIIPDKAVDQDDPRFPGRYTVRTYGSHTGRHIDAIELEIGNRLRAPDRLATTARDIGEAVGLFAQSYLPLDAPRQK
jgi:N-formylglutamate amidohydrolase